MKWLSTDLIVPLASWIFFLGAFIWMLKALFLGFYPDFSVYYYGAKLYLAGQNPYLSGHKLFSGYSYPPIVFLLFVPFTFLPFQNSELLWVILNISFLCISIFILAKIFSIKLFSSTNLLLSGCIFISFPVKFTLGMGQVNILILMLLVISLYLLKKKQEIYSGIFIGLSLGIKLFPLLLPFYFLLKGKKITLIGMMSCLMLLAITVLLFIPERTYLYFIQNVVPYFFSSSWKLEYYSQSLSAFVGRTFGTGGFGNDSKIILSVIIVVATFFAVMKKRKYSFEILSLEYGTVITATMLTNTFSWQHHFVWLVVPFYTVVSFLLKNKKRMNWFLMTLVSYLLVSINFKNPYALPAIFQSHVFFGTLILFFIQQKLLIDKKKV